MSDLTFRKTHSEPASPYANYRGTYVVYDVLVNDVCIGEVWNFRASGDGSRTTYGVGRWAWGADLAPEAEYPTRKEAVADMVNAWLGVMREAG